jgi:S1 RNA binding domain protein
MGAMEIGAIVEGVVVKVMEYGAIVKLDSGESGMVHISQVEQAEPGYEDRPARRGGRDPEFEQKLKRFMSQSQERLVDLKRHREGKR